MATAEVAKALFGQGRVGRDLLDKDLGDRGFVQKSQIWQRLCLAKMEVVWSLFGQGGDDIGSVW